MPILPPKQCTTPGCPNYSKGGRCDQHRAEYQRSKRRKLDSKRESSSKRGYDGTWRKLRLLVLRGEPLCRHCQGNGTLTPATEVDHIVPLRDGGTNHESNLQPLCKSCHSKKTVKEDGAMSWLG